MSNFVTSPASQKLERCSPILSGEIDIIEGVNSQTSNTMTLHTGPNCGITNNNMFTGSIATKNCDVNAPGQSNNAGCGILANNANTYGAGLSAIGGGVYATEWTSNAISIWFFPRNAIHGNINSGSPDPTTWGAPLAQFQGACNIDGSVFNQQIVFDDTFCGDWGGNVWASDSVCARKAATCTAFVANNPGAFTNAYWLINSLNVYQDVTNSESHTTSAPPAGIATTLPPAISSLAPIPPHSRNSWRNGRRPPRSV